MSFAFDMSHWAWPQWTEVGLFGFSLLVNAVLDGQPRTGKYSAGVTLVAASFGLFVLTAGGFFR